MRKKREDYCTRRYHFASRSPILFLRDRIARHPTRLLVTNRQCLEHVKLNSIIPRYLIYILYKKVRKERSINSLASSINDRRTESPTWIKRHKRIERPRVSRKGLDDSSRYAWKQISLQSRCFFFSFSFDENETLAFSWCTSVNICRLPGGSVSPNFACKIIHFATRFQDAKEKGRSQEREFE